MHSIGTDQDVPRVCRPVFGCDFDPVFQLLDAGHSLIRKDLGLVLEVVVEDLDGHLTVDEHRIVAMPVVVSSNPLKYALLIPCNKVLRGIVSLAKNLSFG